MIGMLKGQVLFVDTEKAIIDASGIGFEIFMPMGALLSLPAFNETVLCYTHHVVRDDAQLLFGFLNVEDKQLFQSLIKVNGIGPKVAIKLMSKLSREACIDAILKKDPKILAQCPGIGLKTAERLTVELHDRYSKEYPIGTLSSPQIDQVLKEQATAALQNLGYKPKEIQALLKKAPPCETLEMLLNWALKTVANA